MPSGAHNIDRASERAQARLRDGTFIDPRASDVPPGFELDIADLIDDHVRECGGDLSFAAFKARWVARSFSFVHNARFPELLEGEYVQMLYSAAMARLVRDAAPLVERVAGAYTLFLLYRTQQAVPRVRVYTTARQLGRVLALVRELKAVRVVDGVHILREMADDRAFAVGAVETLMQGERESDGGVGVGSERRPETEKEHPKRRSKRKRKRGGTTHGLSGGEDDQDGDDGLGFSDCGEDSREEVEEEDEEEGDEVDIEDAGQGMRLGASLVGREERGSNPATEPPSPPGPQTWSLPRLQAQVEAASQMALEHLRRTRVPESFAQLSKASEAYGAAMGPVMSTRPGKGTSGAVIAPRLPTTTQMHELIKRQLVKYDGRLRAALRPEMEHQHLPGAPSMSTAPIAVSARGGTTEHRTLSQHAIPHLPPGSRSLSQTPTFGSMPTLLGALGGSRGHGECRGGGGDGGSGDGGGGGRGSRGGVGGGGDGRTIGRLDDSDDDSASE